MSRYIKIPRFSMSIAKIFVPEGMAARVTPVQDEFGDWVKFEDARAPLAPDLTKLPRHQIGDERNTMDPNQFGEWVRLSDVEKLLKGEL